MTKNDGGQAFPRGTWQHGGNIGMSLRAYFAAKALHLAEKDASNMSVSDAAYLIGLSIHEYEMSKHFPAVTAKIACQYADALIAELSK